MTLREVSRTSHVLQIPLKTSKGEQEIFLCPDAHWDNPHCKRDLLKKHLDLAMEKDARIIFPGDTFCLMQGAYDPRKQKGDIRPEHNVNHYLDAVIETAAEWFAPYQSNIDIVGLGNHECVDPETEVLTRRGFIPVAEVTMDDEVAQMHPHTKEVLYSKPNRVHKYDHAGAMVRIQSRSVDMFVTPNHRIAYLSQKSGALRYMFAEDLKSAGQTISIPTCGVEETPAEQPISDDKIRLAAWALTDGGLSDGTLTIYQSKPGMVKHIRALLDRLELSYSHSVRDRAIKEVAGRELVKPPLPQNAFRVAKADWIGLDIGIESKDEIPEWVSGLSERQFDLFMEELILGDGSRHKHQATSMMLYGKRGLLDSVQAVAVSKGYRTMLSPRNRGGSFSYWCLNIVKRASVSVSADQQSTEYYEGFVHCLTTASGNFFARRNGKIFLTGNSSILKRQETDVVARFVQALNINAKGDHRVRAGGYGGWYTIQFESNQAQKSYRIKYFHGSGGGAPVTKGTIQHNRISTMVEGADCIVMGHVHNDYEVTYSVEYMDRLHKPKTKDVLMVRCSTYKDEFADGHSGWHIEKGGGPRPLGGRFLCLNYDRGWAAGTGRGKKKAKSASITAYTYRAV